MIILTSSFGLSVKPGRGVQAQILANFYTGFCRGCEKKDHDIFFFIYIKTLLAFWRLDKDKVPTAGIIALKS